MASNLLAMASTPVAMEHTCHKWALKFGWEHALHYPLRVGSTWLHLHHTELINHVDHCQVSESDSAAITAFICARLRAHKFIVPSREHCKHCTKPTSDDHQPSNGRQPSSDGLHLSSNGRLVAMASNLLAMASTLVAMARDGL